MMTAEFVETVSSFRKKPRRHRQLRTTPFRRYSPRMECRLCGGPSDFVASYDLTPVGGEFWEKADVDRVVELRRCRTHGSYYTARPPKTELLIAQYTALDHGDYYQDPNRIATRRAKRCADMVRQHLPEGARVLDIGGGDGAFASEVAARGCEAWIQEHGKVPNLPQVTVLKDLKDAPAKHFDVITLWDVYEHVWPHGEFLEPIRRLLKPSGKLIIEIPSPSRMVPVFVQMSKVLKSPKSERALAQICNYTHLQLMTASELAATLPKHGFYLLSSKELSELSYRGEEYAIRLLPWRPAAKVVGSLFDRPAVRSLLLGPNKTLAIVCLS